MRLHGLNRSLDWFARSANWPRRLFRQTDGAVAVEFALVSVPFFAILFAILEASLMFFAEQILDTATTGASRLIRTGEAKQAAMTAEQFKQKICDGMFNLVTCDDNLYVDVQSYSTFGAFTPTSPLDSDNNIVATHYTSGNASQIIVVRSFYKWPIYFNYLARSGPITSDGRQLIGSVIAFKTEPFPW